MKKQMRAFSRSLAFLLILFGFVATPFDQVGAQSDTPTPQGKIQPGYYQFTSQVNAASKVPAPDPNLVASGVGQAPASVDATGVDDRENSESVGWYVYEHQTTSDVLTTASTNHLRVVDLYVENSASNIFTVVYVSNTGSYARNWWFLANVTPTDLLNFALTNTARIVVLKAFDDPAGSVRFYAILISNTGADAKTWYFYEGKTVNDLTTLWQANSARITQINSYVKNGVTLYDAVMIANTGTDNRGWYWFVNATVSDLITDLNNTGTRLIDLDIDPATGKYNAVMTTCPSTCPLWWWYVGVKTSDLLNLAAQDGARIIDANTVPGCGDRCWSFILINNSNAITSRVGQMLRGTTDGTVGLYLKQVGGPVLAGLMDGTVFEPASAIKSVVHLYTMRQIQAAQAALTTQITKYLPPIGSSCPGNTANGTEAIKDADREMMWHSDNTRTRELDDYFGNSNINLMANAVGLTHTAINHIIGCGGPIPDQTTLDDLAVLYEGVANATLVNSTYRNLFFSQMAGKAQFKSEGYDWTGLWTTDLPNIIQQEAPNYYTQAQRNAYLNWMDLAYKAGNYNLCQNVACSTLVYDIAISGWAKIPFCDAGGARQYVFGTYIYNASNPTNSSAAFNATKAELLREQIHAGMASCHPSTTFIPQVNR